MYTSSEKPATRSHRRHLTVQRKIRKSKRPPTLWPSCPYITSRALVTSYRGSQQVCGKRRRARDGLQTDVASSRLCQESVQHECEKSADTQFVMKKDILNGVQSILLAYLFTTETCVMWGGGRGRTGLRGSRGRGPEHALRQG